MKKFKAYFLPLLALFSINSHAQWSQIDSINSGNINSINFINADTGFVYNQPGVIRRTANGGQSWDTIGIDFTGYIYDMDFNSNSVGYAVGGAWFPHGRHYPYAIFRTTDAGQSWDSVYSGINGGVFTNVEVIDDNEFFATGSFGMVHSIDGGLSLDTVNVSTLPFGAEVYERIRFLNAGHGYVIGRAGFFGGTLVNLYETADGGQSWQSIYSDSTISFTSDFVMTSSGRGIIVGNGDYIERTTNGGNSWQTIAMADPDLLLYHIEEVDDHLYAIGSHDADTITGIFYSSDWGSTWQRQFAIKGVNGNIVDISIPSSGAGYFATWREVYKNKQLISLPEPRNFHFELYPNPASGEVFIELPTNDGVQVQLFNLHGQKVMEFASVGEAIRTIDVSGFKPGMYILNITYDGQSFSRRLVKE